MKSSREQVLPDIDSSINLQYGEDPAIGHEFHFHPEIELTYIESGNGWHFAGESVGEFADGYLTLLGPMIPHLFLSREEAAKKFTHTRIPSPKALPSVFVIKFANNLGLGEGINLPEFFSIKKLLQEGYQGVVFPPRAVDMAVPIIKKAFTSKPMRRFMTVLELLDVLGRSDYRKLDAGQVSGGQTDSRITRVLRFIGERLDQDSPPSLADAAGFIYMSPGAFSRYFHQKTHKTFIEYISALKINKAMRLLREKNWTICQIAYSCGFENLSNFNRHFQKLNHLTPREFRKLLKQE